MSEVFYYPAPVGGINLRDGILTIPKTDAYSLVNFLANGNFLATRKGYSQVGNIVDEDDFAPTALAVFETESECHLLMTSPRKIKVAKYNFATNEFGDWYDLWSDNTIQNSKTVYKAFQWKNKLWLVNGIKNFVYDGLSVSPLPFKFSFDPRILDKFDNFCLLRDRLIFSTKDGRIFYSVHSGDDGTIFHDDLETLSIHAAVLNNAELNLLASWTRSTADGTTSQLVVGTSKGSVILYSEVFEKENQSVAIPILLKFDGIFPIPDIVGGKNYAQVFAALIINTSRGLLSISDLMFQVSNKDGFSNKINKYIEDNFSDDISYSLKYLNVDKFLFYNIYGKDENLTFVFDSASNTWTSFDGLDAIEFVSVFNNIYFLKSSKNADGKLSYKVCKLFDGNKDDVSKNDLEGKDIVCSSESQVFIEGQGELKLKSLRLYLKLSPGYNKVLPAPTVRVRGKIKILTDLQEGEHVELFDIILKPRDYHNLVIMPTMNLCSFFSIKLFDVVSEVPIEWHLTDFKLF